MTRVEESAPGVISLSGELLFGSVMTVRQELEALLSRQKGSCQLDLGGVTRVDSSALALWLACCRLARRDGVELSIANLPADLKAIADLVGLDGALSQV